MKIVRHIPNFMTCLNLISGMAGIYYVLEGEVSYGAYFIFAAAILDFFDGFVARLLHVSSDIGKQLDSLADLVTFGILPAFIVFKMLEKVFPGTPWPFLAFFIGVQSAIRLAKFNIDTRQTDIFIGIPTPANALLLSTLPILADQYIWAEKLVYNPYFLLVFPLLFALLLTAEIPLIALKFSNFTMHDNWNRYLILLISLIFLLIMGIGGIPFAIIVYVILSIVEAKVKGHGQHKMPL